MSDRNDGKSESGLSVYALLETTAGSWPKPLNEQFVISSSIKYCRAVLRPFSVAISSEQ